MGSLTRWVEFFKNGALTELELVDEQAVLAAWGFIEDAVVGLWRNIFRRGRGIDAGEKRM